MILMLEKASESVFNCAATTCWTRFALGKKWSNVSRRANQFGPGFWHTIIYSLEASVHGSSGEHEGDFRFGAPSRDRGRRIRVRGAWIVRHPGLRRGRSGHLHRDGSRLKQRRAGDHGGRALGERLGPRRGSRASVV